MAKQDEKTMLEQLLEAIEQSRMMIRELHEAAKDTKALLKELREEQDKAVLKQSEAMTAAASYQLEALVPSVKKVLHATLDTHTHMLERNVTKIMIALDQIHAKYREVAMAMEAGVYLAPPEGKNAPWPTQSKKRGKRA